MPRQYEELRFSLKAGWSGYPLVGTADHIVDRIETIAKLGIDGMILNWVDFLDGMARWEKDVMPRLEQAGLRRPVKIIA